MNALTIAIGKRVLQELVKAVRRDRRNRYALVSDWALPRLFEPIPDYDSKRFSIADSIITVRRYTDPNTCDGATLAPDKIGPWKPVIGAIFHDPWYQEIAQISAAWGWPQRDVRRLGDRIFYTILLHIAPAWLARVYYRGVRACGGLAHWAGKLLAVSALLCLVGCCAPKPAFNPDDLTPPDYNKTAACALPPPLNPEP